MTDLRQGQVWTVKALSGDRDVVVLDGPATLELGGPVIVAALRELREVPNEKLALVTAVEPGSTTVVSLYDLAVYRQASFTAQQSTLSGDALEAVRETLRARFDL